MINILSYFCIILGIIFIISSIIGCFRFPDYFIKMHAATIGEVVGTPLFIAGLALQAQSIIFALKIFLLGVILLIINPTASYFLNRIAIKKGLTIYGKKR